MAAASEGEHRHGNCTGVFGQAHLLLKKSYGLLIVVFDEADTLDFTAGGGQVAAVIISPLAKRGYKSIAFYQHQSVLRLALEDLGVTKLPERPPQHQLCGSFSLRRRADFASIHVPKRKTV